MRKCKTPCVILVSFSMSTRETSAFINSDHQEHFCDRLPVSSASTRFFTLESLPIPRQKRSMYEIMDTKPIFKESQLNHTNGNRLRRTTAFKR